MKKKRKQKEKLYTIEVNVIFQNIQYLSPDFEWGKLIKYISNKGFKYMNSLLIKTTNEESTIIIPILQMRRLR